MKTHSLSYVIATALLLSACGGSSTSAPENTPMTAETSSQVAESASAQPQATSQSSTAPQEAGASSSLTQSAGAVTTVTSVFPVDTRTAADGHIGILMSPTGNIGCDIWAVEGYAACGVISYYDEAKYPSDSAIGPAWVFPLGNDIESIEIAPRGDAMFFEVYSKVSLSRLPRLALAADPLAWFASLTRRFTPAAEPAASLRAWVAWLLLNKPHCSAGKRSETVANNLKKFGIDSVCIKDGFELFSEDFFNYIEVKNEA